MARERGHRDSEAFMGFSAAFLGSTSANLAAAGSKGGQLGPSQPNAVQVGRRWGLLPIPTLGSRERHRQKCPRCQTTNSLPWPVLAEVESRGRARQQEPLALGGPASRACHPAYSSR